MALRYHTVVAACARARFIGRRWLASAALCSALACGDDDGAADGVRVDRPDAADMGADVDAGEPRPASGPRLPPADGEVVLPFAGPVVEYPITVSAQPGVLDVHFSVDTTGSIDAEIDQLQAELSRSIVPGLRRRVAQVSFGVSRFADFPREPFGFDGSSTRQADTPFELLSPVTDTLTRVSSAVARLDQPLDNGGDLPEAGAEALWQIATGEGYSAAGKRLIRAFSPDDGTVGGVGFRAGALRVVLHVTDAPSHSPSDYGDAFPGTHSLAEASAALVAIRAKLVGIVSGVCSECDPFGYALTRTELESVALATGALGAEPKDEHCPHGVDGSLVPAAEGACPLVFDVDEAGRGLSDTILDGIVDLLDGIRFGVVSSRISDDPLGFVRAVVPVGSAGGEEQAEVIDLLPEGDPDGQVDSFRNVRGKTQLVFRVQLRNEVIRASDVDQLFRAVVSIEGDGLVVEHRTIRIRVPAGAGLLPDPGDTDAGP